MLPPGKFKDAISLRRGGDRSFISLNDSSAEVRYSTEPAAESPLSP